MTIASRIRAENVFEVPLGTVVKDTKGDPWVFCGWPKVAGGKAMHFAKGMDMYKYTPHFSYAYNASYSDVLLAKFPGLAEYRK